MTRERGGRKAEGGIRCAVEDDKNHYDLRMSIL